VATAPEPPPTPAPAPALPGVPSLTPPADATPPVVVAVPTASDAAPRKELVEAKAEAQLKAERAKVAEKDAQSASDRMAVLDQIIADERKLLQTSQRKADNANESSAQLARELEEKWAANATPDVLSDLTTKKHEAEARVQAARAEVRKSMERLDELQSERASLQAEQLKALRTAEVANKELEAAEKSVERLQNPFAFLNIIRWAADHGPKLIVILLGMVILYTMSRFISKQIVSVMSRGSQGSTREERENRARTLVGVFQNASAIGIVVGGVLMAFEEIGIPVAPLMGGAAVLGLAVAFGAQNLIRDYFYGFVILMENQFTLNDVVKIGANSGQVEQITLRMTVLRDLEGNVHFIPNGEITSVTNMTHGWSRALFEIGVAYKEDADRVIGVIKELGAEMRRDPLFGLMILEDLTMLGVDSFGDSAVMIKFFIKTRPLQQWAVRREFLRRTKRRFDDLGIEIPFPHRTVFHRYEGQNLGVEGAPAEGHGVAQLTGGNWTGR